MQWKQFPFTVHVCSIRLVFGNSNRNDISCYFNFKFVLHDFNKRRVLLENCNQCIPSSAPTPLLFNLWNQARDSFFRQGSSFFLSMRYYCEMPGMGKISMKIYKRPEVSICICLSVGDGEYFWVHACISRWSKGGSFQLLRMIWISPSLSGSLSFKCRYFTSVSCSQPLTKKYNTERVPVSEVCPVLKGI